MFLLIVGCAALFTTSLGQSTAATGAGTEPQAVNTDQTSYIHMVTAESFEEFITGKNVKILYFYKKNIPRMKKFKAEFEKSASYLSNYEVSFGWIDCATENVQGYCDKKGVESEIYAFKDGEMLLDLTLETMFDVNSMVSNVLQIVLLREVPILQSQVERKDFEKTNKGKNLIFFGYFPAIGTLEHRVFMEVAYSYRNKHLFSLTTEKEAIKDLGYSKKKAAIWCFHSKNIQAEQLANDKIHRYRGKFNVGSFDKFVTSMSEPKFYELNSVEDLEANPFEDAQMHLGIIFYDSKTESKARRTIETLSVNFLGVIGFFLCNTEKVDAAAFGLPESTGPFPLLAVLFHDENEPVFMDKHDIEEHGVDLILKELNKRMGEEKLETDVSSTEESEVIDENDPTEIEKLDDQVALGAYSLRKNTIKESYIVLNDKNFIKETKNHQLKVVLFHLPFDIQSQAFIRVYSEAAHALKQDGVNVLAAINCFDWTDVCAKNNITSYPLVRIYRKGQKPTDYKGLLDYSAIISTVKMYLVESPFILHQEDDVKMFSEGQIPENIGLHTNTSVVAMAATNKDVKLFKELAEILHGNVMVGLVTGSALSNQIARKFNCQPPCVVVHKRDDAYQPHHVLKQESSASKMAQSVMDAKIPKFSQISVKSFPTLYARKQPMLILFDKNLKPKTGLHDVIGNIASSEKFPSLIFTFIDIEKQRSLAGNLLFHYQLGVDSPCVFIVNTKKLTIHKYQDESITENGVTSWVQKVLDGSIEPDRLMEKKKWAPRLSGYNYLEMLDDEQRQFNEEDTVSNSDEEDNLGFDENGEEVGHEYGGPSTAATEPEDDIEQDLHDLKKSRLFHTRDSGTTEHRIHSNLPSNTGSANDNGHVEHNEL